MNLDESLVPPYDFTESPYSEIQSRARHQQIVFAFNVNAAAGQSKGLPISLALSYLSIVSD